MKGKRQGRLAIMLLFVALGGCAGKNGLGGGHQGLTLHERASLQEARDALDKRINQLQNVVDQEAKIPADDISGGTINDMIEASSGITAEDNTLLREFDEKTGQNDSDLMAALTDLDRKTTQKVSSQMAQIVCGTRANNIPCPIAAVKMLAEGVEKTHKLILVSNSRINYYLDRTAAKANAKAKAEIKQRTL